MDDRLSNEGLKSSDRLKQEVNKEHTIWFKFEHTVMVAHDIKWRDD